MQLKNDRLLRALRREPVDCTPVWLMRQAGRYLPEYRQVREQAGDFLTLCKTPELACEVSLQPLRRFPLDAAIIFSDILTIPDAMGLGLYFATNEGPCFRHPIKTAADIAKLGVPDPESDLRYVGDAIRLLRSSLGNSLPIIGFAGSPWTLATYMVEGGTSKAFTKIKALMYREPAQLHALLTILAQSVAVYLNAQIAAGANAIMIFDTWGGVLTTAAYHEFSLAYMTLVIEQLQRYADEQKIPVILFTKGGGPWLESIAASGCDAVGIDWTLNLGDVRRRIGHQVALQGNLDPCTLYATPERIVTEVRAILDSYGPGPGHVFNFGHGIHPDIPIEHVAALVHAVHGS